MVLVVALMTQIENVLTRSSIKENQFAYIMYIAWWLKCAGALSFVLCTFALTFRNNHKIRVT